MKRVLTSAVLALAVLINATGCSFAQCKIKDRVVEAAGESIARGLECKNVKAVTADTDAFVKSLGLCNAKSEVPTGPIADTVCPAVGAALVGWLATGIPDTWQCTASNAKDKAKDLFVGQCRRVPLADRKDAPACVLAGLDQ